MSVASKKSAILLQPMERPFIAPPVCVDFRNRTLANCAAQEIAGWLNRGGPLLVQKLPASLRSFPPWQEAVACLLDRGPLLELFPTSESLRMAARTMSAWNLQLLLANFYRVAAQEDYYVGRLKILRMVGAAFCTGDADCENPLRVEPLRRLGVADLHWEFVPGDFADGFNDVNTLAGLERLFFLTRAWGKTCGQRPTVYGFPTFPVVPVQPLEGYYLPSLYRFRHGIWETVDQKWLSHFFIRKNQTSAYPTQMDFNLRPVLKKNFAPGSAELLLTVAIEMSWANQIGAFHQTIALGTWVLGGGLFWTSAPDTMRRFGADIWGMLGVALAHCWVVPDAVFCCLTRMDFFTRLPSHQRGVALADFQIVCRWGLASPSRQLFIALANDPLFPRMSTDFHWCLRHYFDLELRNLEDKLLRFARENHFHSQCSLENLSAPACCKVLAPLVAKECDAEVCALKEYLRQLMYPLGAEGALLIRMLESSLNAASLVKTMWFSANPMEAFHDREWVRHDLLDLFQLEDDLSSLEFDHLPRNLVAMECFDALLALEEGADLNLVNPVEDCVFRVRVANKRTYSVEAGDVLVTAVLILLPFEVFRAKCIDYLSQALEHYVRATHGKHHRVGLLAEVRNVLEGSRHDLENPEDFFAFRFHPDRPSHLSEEGKRRFGECFRTDGTFSDPKRGSDTRGLSDLAYAAVDRNLVCLLHQLEERLVALERFGRESLSYELLKV